MRLPPRAGERIADFLPPPLEEGRVGGQARTKISTDRDVKSNAVQASATEQFAALDTAIQQKQARVVEVGEAKAKEAEAVGQQQAARATEGCNARGYQALLLADQKAQRYASYNRAGLIGRTAHEMGSDLAKKIQQAGAEMSAAAHKDAADMAAKFRKEASQVAEKFVDVRESAQTKIQQARDQTVDALHQMADSSTSPLEQNSRDTLAKQKEGKQAAGAELRALAVAAQGSITDAAENACVKVDTETAQASKQLAGVVRRVAPKLQGHGPAKERSRQAAQAQVVTAVAQF